MTNLAAAKDWTSLATTCLSCGAATVHCLLRASRFSYYADKLTSAGDRRILSLCVAFVPYSSSYPSCHDDRGDPGYY